MAFLLSPKMFIVCLVLLYGHPACRGDLFPHQCDQTGNYTANSTFQSNLNLLLHSLTSNGSASGFYNDTIGRNPDQAYGLVLCRGDTSATSCRACLDVATHDVLQLCPYNKGAVIWYDYCLLRYSDQNIFSSDSRYPEFYMWNTESNSVAPDRFIELVEGLMGNISNNATNNSRRFATGELDIPSWPLTVYGLVQCIPIISDDQCLACLEEATNSIGTFKAAQGGRVLGWECIIRYELYSFFYGAATLMVSSPYAGNGNGNGDGTATPPPPPPPPPPPGVPPIGERGQCTSS